jgi:hypothetical protein
LIAETGYRAEGMIDYEIVHHVPGRIKLKVPVIKKLRIDTLKKLSKLPVPKGIKDINANPLTGSLVITYDPDCIDILRYVQEMVADKELLAAIGNG